MKNDLIKVWDTFCESLLFLGLMFRDISIDAAQEFMVVIKDPMFQLLGVVFALIVIIFFV